MNRLFFSPWFPVFFFAGVRLAASPFFGLGVDEAHYVLYGQYPDWSYFDHPPLVGWTHTFFAFFLGTSELAARIPAILLFLLTNFLLIRFFRPYATDRQLRYGLWAVNAAFVPAALGFMLLPDTLLLPITLGIMLLVRKMEEKAELSGYLLMGLLLGLAGLAKYSAVLLLPSLLFYLAWRKRWDLLWTPKLLVTAMVALAAVSPVLYWNVVHDWASFAYQSDHVAGGEGVRWKAVKETLAGQILGYSPFLFPLAVYGLVAGWRKEKMAVAFGGVALLFFLFTGLSKTVLPHWTVLFFLLFLPLGVMEAVEHRKRWVVRCAKASVFLTAGVTLFLFLELAGKFLSLPDYQSLHRDTYGWDRIMAEGNRYLAEVPGTSKGLAVMNWTQGSRARYYDLPYGSPVFVLDDRTDQFDFWEGVSPEGWNLVVVQTRFNKKSAEERLACGRSRELGVLELALNGGKVNRARYVLCEGYAGLR